MHCNLSSSLSLFVVITSFTSFTALHCLSFFLQSSRGTMPDPVINTSRAVGIAHELVIANKREKQVAREDNEK